MKFLLILLNLFAFAFSGCGSKETPQPAEQGPLKITAEIFPAWDWTRNILGENPGGIELTLLNDSGVDMHSYQPSVDDILTIHNSDLFIYVGGESDQWVSDALRSADAASVHLIKLLDVLGEEAKAEEFTEGMQRESTSSEDNAQDEHVWLSLSNAALFTDAIAAELGTLDPEHASLYQENAAAYKEQLTELDAVYRETIDTAPGRTLIFGDRFPFRYLVDDYGLDYYAAFSGCSAETEASFETISFIAGKVDAVSPGSVLTIDGSDQRVAETIVRNTSHSDIPIRTLNSMQAVSAEQIRDGITYLSVMEDNLAVLREALGVK